MSRVISILIVMLAAVVAAAGVQLPPGAEQLGVLDNAVAYFQRVSSAAGTGTSTQLQRTLVRRYTGAGHVIDNDSVKMTRFPGGYLSRGGSAYYYLTDYQGNNIAVVDAGGSIIQRTDYYPYGEPWRYPYGQQYLYSDKELTRADGRHAYTFPARTMLPSIPRWSTTDPLAKQTPWDSPYAYCAANPIANIDPTGLSTFVVDSGGGKYQIVGGVEDSDRSIYYGRVEGRKFYKEGKLGITPTVTSFYDSDTGKWATDCFIDVNDNSGIDFLKKFIVETPPDPVTYAQNAGNGQIYDFKATNGNIPTTRELKHYRGMPIQNREDNQKMYASARDIGNIGAGYVVGFYKILWCFTRIVFDAYNLKKNREFPEGRSSQNAQLYGYRLGWRASDIIIINAFESVVNSYTNAIANTVMRIVETIVIPISNVLQNF